MYNKIRGFNMLKQNKNNFITTLHPKEVMLVGGGFCWFNLTCYKEKILNWFGEIKKKLKETEPVNPSCE